MISTESKGCHLILHPTRDKQIAMLVDRAELDFQGIKNPGKLASLVASISFSSFMMQNCRHKYTLPSRAVGTRLGRRRRSLLLPKGLDYYSSVLNKCGGTLIYFEKKKNPTNIHLIPTNKFRNFPPDLHFSPINMDNIFHQHMHLFRSTI